MSLRPRLEAALAAGQDSALLRFTLGDLLFKAGELDTAIHHLQQAVALDPQYSAAWALLGRSQLKAGQPQAAHETLTQGLVVAQAQGDRQAERSMQVFLKRIDRR